MPAAEDFTAPPAAIDLMREQCMRYSKTGHCSTRRCLIRGGALAVDGATYEDRIAMATCEYHEAVKAFEACGRLSEALVDAQHALEDQDVFGDDPKITAAIRKIQSALHNAT